MNRQDIFFLYDIIRFLELLKQLQYCFRLNIMTINRLSYIYCN